MDEEKDLNENQTPGEDGQGENAAGGSQEDSGADSSEASQEGSRE